MSTVSLRFNSEEEKFLKEMAEFEGEKFSSYLKKVIFESIEDKYDLKIYQEAKAEFEKNPKIYSHEEVKKELGL